MTQLYLLIYKQDLKGFKLPAMAGHWVILLPYKEGGSVGNGFGVNKQTMSLTAKYTQYAITEASLDDDLERYMPIEVTFEGGTGVLSRICTDVTHNRPFHFITRNCQHWVCEVLEKVVQEFPHLNPNGAAEVAKFRTLATGRNQ
jgi:hypothetical protein